MLEENKKKKNQNQPGRSSQVKVDQMEEAFEKYGWIVVKSKALGGEYIVIVKNSNVIIPIRWQSAISYTLEEVAELLELPRPTDEALKQLHEIKKTFSGRVTGVNL